MENNEVMEYTNTEAVEAEETSDNTAVNGGILLGAVALIGGAIGYGIKAIKDRKHNKTDEPAEEKPTLRQKIAYRLLKKDAVVAEVTADNVEDVK